MAGASLRIDKADSAMATLANFIARAERPRGMFENIGMSMVTSTQHRFETGIAPSGSPWPPSLRALAEGSRTLIDSARLMQSIAYRAWDAGVEWGTNVIYAAIHQFGGIIRQAARTQEVHFKRGSNSGELLPGFRRKGKGTESRTVSIGERTIHMPERPFLGMDEADNSEIINIAEEWLAFEGVRR
jgi:phage virion morphogenesis protein